MDIWLHIYILTKVALSPPKKNPSNREKNKEKEKNNFTMNWMIPHFKIRIYCKTLHF